MAAVHGRGTREAEKTAVSIPDLIPEKESGGGMSDYSFMCMCFALSQLICRKPCPEHL